MTFVYIAKSGSSNYFKIGKTNGNVDKRLIALNTGNPEKLIKFDVIETSNASLCERYMHKTLRTKKYFGSGGTEFFEMSELEMRETISETRLFIQKYLSQKNIVEEFKKEQSNGDSVQPNEEQVAIFQKLLEIRQQIDLLEAEKDMLEFSLKIAIGKSAELSGIATWKSTKRTILDQNRLKEELPEVFNEYKTTRIGRTFKLLD